MVYCVNRSCLFGLFDVCAKLFLTSKQDPPLRRVIIKVHIEVNVLLRLGSCKLHMYAHVQTVYFCPNTLCCIQKIQSLKLMSTSSY